jgi:hypothetical protein
MTKAHRDGRNCGTMGVLSFIGFVIACDACVTRYCISHFCCVYIEERLKHIDVKWLFLLLNYDSCLRCDFRY